MKLRRGGIQVEIVANLFAMTFAALAIAVVAMTSFTAKLARDDALDRLRMGSRQLQTALERAPRLADVAALARATPARIAGGEFRVLDGAGRELGGDRVDRRQAQELQQLAAATVPGGEVIEEASLWSGELVLVTSIRSSRGEPGFLVGRYSGEDFRRRLGPIVAGGAWLLFTATLVFVGFGFWLLRRRVVAPLSALAEGTRRIAEGDLGARLEAEGPAELAALARSFNDMAEALAADRVALERAHESLSRGRRLASIGQLAAGVAHEVGNPVAAILGYAEVCQRDRGATDRTRELAERIGEEALRIRTLVREMLDLARPDALALVRVQPAELVAKTAERMRVQPLLAGVALEVASDPQLPAVEVDLRRLDQIFTNLVENAAHALRGVPDARIELRAESAHDGARPARRAGDPSAARFVGRRAPDAVALRVIDNGPGIDPEHLPYVFDPFFTTKEPGEGTGLGLWNAHRLAEVMGGRLEVASQSGRTCFSLLLPVADTKSAHGKAAGADHR